MKPSEVLAPIGAVLGTLLSLACCLPLAALGGLGAGGVGIFLGRASPWLQGMSLGLVGLSLVSLVRGRRSCQTRSRAREIIVVVAAIFVLTVLLLPQLVADLVAALPL